MAEQSYTDVSNDVSIWPTDSDAVANALNALERSFGVNIFQPLYESLKKRSVMVRLGVAAVSASGTAEVIWRAPFPCKIRFYQAGVRTLNSAASLTVDVQVKVGSASYATTLDAAETITTAIATPARFAPESSTAIQALATLGQNDLVKAIFTAGSGGNPADAFIEIYAELL